MGRRLGRAGRRLGRAGRRLGRAGRRLGWVRLGRAGSAEVGRQLGWVRQAGALRPLAPRRTAARPPDHRVDEIPQFPQCLTGRLDALPVRIRQRTCRIFPVCAAAQILVLAPQLVAGPVRNAPAHRGLPFCSRTPDASSARRGRPDRARPSQPHVRPRSAASKSPPVLPRVLWVGYLKPVTSLQDASASSMAVPAKSEICDLAGLPGARP
jgi:hypothetical protein